MPSLTSRPPTGTKENRQFRGGREILNKGNKLKFVENLCQKLESEPLGYFDDEASLEDFLTKAIGDWKNSTSHKDEIQVWNDRFMIERVRAFNWKSQPDISIDWKDNRTFVALEIKRGHEDRRRGPVKSGIGQAIIYSAKYDYVILFCLLMADFRPELHEYDEKIRSDLWDKHRIKVIIRYEQP